MGLGPQEYSELLMVCVTLIGLLLTVGVVVSFRHTLRSFMRWMVGSLSPDAKTARDAVADLSKAIGSVRQHAQGLERYAGDYLSVFEEAGWSRLLSELEALEQAEKLLHKMIDAEQYDDAIGLSGMLLDQLPEDLTEYAAKKFGDFAPLRGWNERSRAVLIAIVDHAKIAAKANRELGIRRVGQRKPTLETLAELRKWLRGH